MCFCEPLTQFSPGWHHLWHICEYGDTDTGMLLLTKIQTSFEFHHFSISILVPSRIQSSIPHSFSCHISPIFSGLWQFHSLSLFLMTLTILRSPDVLTMSHNQDVSVVFPVIRLRLWGWGKNITVKVPFSWHHIKEWMTSVWHLVSLVLLPLTTWLR